MIAVDFISHTRDIQLESNLWNKSKKVRNGVDLKFSGTRVKKSGRGRRRVLSNGRYPLLQDELSLCKRSRTQRNSAIKSTTSCNVKLPKIPINKNDVGRTSQRRLGRTRSISELGLGTFSSQLKTKFNAGLANEVITEGKVSDKNSKNSRRKKSPYIIYAIRPSNLLEEKRRFMANAFRYNPQFYYETPADDEKLASYSVASFHLLPQAIKIMELALQRHGCYENFEEVTAGRKITPSEFQARFDDYLVAEGLQGQVILNMTPDLLSRALMTRSKGKSCMNVRLSILRDHWTEGLLQHEIGTHYLRAANNRQQPWRNGKSRRRFNLLPLNPTEEGLASLHSVLGREDPCLWRAALLYYTVYYASQFSFVELFEKLRHFVQDPEVRWDYCMRAKRGQTDTSKPGCFNKDQVYLEGILQILRYRHEIDFHSLVRLGKVSFKDVERIKCDGMLDPCAVKIPSFMENLEDYRHKLSQILLKNGLTDMDLRAIYPEDMYERDDDL